MIQPQKKNGRKPSSVKPQSLDKIGQKFSSEQNVPSCSSSSLIVGPRQPDTHMWNTRLYSGQEKRNVSRCGNALYAYRGPSWYQTWSEGTNVTTSNHIREIRAPLWFGFQGQRVFELSCWLSCSWNCMSSQVVYLCTSNKQIVWLWLSEHLVPVCWSKYSRRVENLSNLDAIVLHNLSERPSLFTCFNLQFYFTVTVLKLWCLCYKILNSNLSHAWMSAFILYIYFFILLFFPFKMCTLCITYINDCSQTDPSVSQTNSPALKHMSLVKRFFPVRIEPQIWAPRLQENSSRNIFKCLYFEMHSAVWHSSGRGETCNYNNTPFNNMHTGWPGSSWLLGGACSLPTPVPPLHARWEF